jgi:SET domain-containing protein
MSNNDSKLVFVKKSKNGRGIFAKRNIETSQMIIQIKGKLITCYEDDNLDEQTRSNTIRFNNEKFISPKGELGELINHSCNPNTKIVKKNQKLFIIAIKPIGKNAEVTFDYSTVLASDDIWKMKCNCGSKNCRKIIKKFKTLPKKIKESYIESKIVPSFILKI